MHFYIALFLTLAAAVTLVLLLREWGRGNAGAAAPYASLTMLLIAVVGLMAPMPVDIFYKGALVLALFLSLFAVLFFTLPGRNGPIGLVLAAIGYFLCLLAFASQTRLQLPTWWALALLAVAAATGWWLYRRSRARWVALAYLLLLTLLLWQAIELPVQLGQSWVWYAFAGAFLHAAANAVLAYDRLAGPVSRRNSILALLYFAGQACLAWSIWGPGVPFAA